MAASPEEVMMEKYHRDGGLRALRCGVVWEVAAGIPGGSLPTMSGTSASPEDLRCEVCGRFEAVEVGDHRLCESCYAEAGTCGAGGDPGDGDAASWSPRSPRSSRSQAGGWLRALSHGRTWCGPELGL